MQRTKWIERRFEKIEDNGLLPGIIERLDGTYARLLYKIDGHSNERLSLGNNGSWSVKEEIGHLSDLEPLWYRRVKELINDKTLLSAADMSNEKTHKAHHNEKEIVILLKDFRIQRDKLIYSLRKLSDEDLLKTAIHPRLQTPMRIIDLAFFVAEHDDHHLAQMSYLISL